MSSLLERIAARHIRRKTGEDQPLPEHRPEMTGAIKPFMPGFSPDMLKDILDSRDKSPQLSRVGTKEFTHVSTLTAGVCTRQHVIAALHDKREWEPVTGGHRLMWKFGRTAEAHIREVLTRDAGRQRFQIYGDWKCRCERTNHVGTKPANLTCRTCGHPADIYHEAPFYDEEYGMIGNPDLSLILGRYFIVTEIKSMTANQWDDLVAPLAEHVNQALDYRWMAERRGFLVHNKVIIIYAKKEFKWGSPYKEFHVDVTTPPYQRMLQTSLDLALEIKQGIAANLPPPRLSRCTDIDARTPKGCPACATCFALPNGV